MKLRRLDPEQDRKDFVEAWIWESSAPSWFKSAGRVFGPPTFEDFIQGSKEENRATFGIFEKELIGLIILTLRNKESIEVDLTTKPRCSPAAILEAAIALRDRIFEDLQTEELYVWIPRKNFPTRRLCSILGFRETGLTLIRGTYRNRVIEWLHLSITREAVEMLKAA
jgi:hypothetical protein